MHRGVALHAQASAQSYCHSPRDLKKAPEPGHLGLYTDPYQYAGALGGELHRALRLVVDVGLHTGKLTREQAIEYLLGNELISEQGATA